MRRPPDRRRRCGIPSRPIRFPIGYQCLAQAARAGAAGGRHGQTTDRMSRARGGTKLCVQRMVSVHRYPIGSPSPPDGGNATAPGQPRGDSWGLSGSPFSPSTSKADPVSRPLRRLGLTAVRGKPFPHSADMGIDDRLLKPATQRSSLGFGQARRMLVERGFKSLGSDGLQSV